MLDRRACGLAGDARDACAAGVELARGEAAVNGGHEPRGALVPAGAGRRRDVLGAGQVGGGDLGAGLLTHFAGQVGRGERRVAVQLDAGRLDVGCGADGGRDSPPGQATPLPVPPASSSSVALGSGASSSELADVFHAHGWTSSCTPAAPAASMALVRWAKRCPIAGRDEQQPVGVLRGGGEHFAVGVGDGGDSDGDGTLGQVGGLRGVPDEGMTSPTGLPVSGRPVTTRRPSRPMAPVTVVLARPSRRAPAPDPHDTPVRRVAGIEHVFVLPLSTGRTWIHRSARPPGFVRPSP